MGKTRKKSIIINCVLTCIFAVVFGVCVISSSVIPIYSIEMCSAIYNGDQSKKNVSLMFNVYENTKTVNNIIDILNSKNVKATFFVGGCWADDNEQTLKRIVFCGHEIANHGYFHKDHKNISYENNLKEIANADKVIYSLCGVKPTLFAPPSGSFSNDTLSVCEELGYKVIMWSKDTIDWRDSDIKKIYQRATKNVKNGDLILMHPKEHTAKILPDIIDYYTNNGFDLVSVSNNIGAN